MLEMANDFELKDNDCMQCGKEIEPRKFLFIQAIWIGSDKKENEYIVVADTVLFVNLFKPKSPLFLQIK